MMPLYTRYILAKELLAFFLESRAWFLILYNLECTYSCSNFFTIENANKKLFALVHFGVKTEKSKIKSELLTRQFKLSVVAWYCENGKNISRTVSNFKIDRTSKLQRQTFFEEHQPDKIHVFSKMFYWIMYLVKL